MLAVLERKLVGGLPGIRVARHPRLAEQGDRVGAPSPSVLEVMGRVDQDTVLPERAPVLAIADLVRVCHAAAIPRAV